MLFRSYLQKASEKVLPTGFSSPFLAKIYQKALDRHAQGLEPTAAACMTGLTDEETRHLSHVLSGYVRSNDVQAELSDYISIINTEYEKRTADDDDDFLRQLAARRLTDGRI